MSNGDALNTAEGWKDSNPAIADVKPVQSANPGTQVAEH